jgi:2-keto-4-pentenoate hydratase/2-oxohepta-3-ene-1,7-dioic acid hydratase in catechol pathway
MKLCTFEHAALARSASSLDDAIVDLAAAAPELPREMTRCSRRASRRLRARATRRARDAPLALDSVRLLRADPAPAEVPRDRPQLRRSRRGGGLETPKFPTVFNKQSTCVVGPARRDPHAARLLALDYEGELGFVIGRRCRHVPRARATR